MFHRWVSQYAKAFAQGFIIGLPVCITFVDNVCSVARVNGSSMQPTLNPDPRSPGDIVVLSRWAIRNFKGISKGDIVSVVVNYSLTTRQRPGYFSWNYEQNDPTDPNIVLIKRVIALEGDCVKTLKHKRKLVKVPRGHCWVEGDNHSHSLDSNTFGPVAVGLIQSKATRIVWPPKRWRKIESYLPEDRTPVDLHHELEELEDNNCTIRTEPKDKNNDVVTEEKDTVSELAIFPDKFGPIS